MLFTRRIYQTNTSLEDAYKIWFDFIKTLKSLESEEIAVIDSLSRVTAEAVQAKISSPFYHASAMDGYAVRFDETFGASETMPLRLLLHEQAVPVNTGDPLPDGFNAVIMVEDVNLTGDHIEIISPTAPYRHVRAVGEDIVKTELILPENHSIRPVDIGAMLSGGNSIIKVRKRPFVTIIPTGNEIVEPGVKLKVGNIIDSNSYMIGGLVNTWGAEYNRTDVARFPRNLLHLASRPARERAFVPGCREGGGGARPARGLVIHHINSGGVL